eukprot:1518730-Prymnesium_polylepis.1
MRGRADREGTVRHCGRTEQRLTQSAESAVATTRPRKRRGTILRHGWRVLQFRQRASDAVWEAGFRLSRALACVPGEPPPTAARTTPCATHSDH